MYLNDCANREIKRLEERVAKLERAVEELAKGSSTRDDAQPSQSQAAA